MTALETARRALSYRVDGQITVMVSLMIGAVALFATVIVAFFALKITGSFAEAFSGASYEPTGLDATSTVVSGTALKLIVIGASLGIPLSLGLFLYVGGRINSSQPRRR